MNKQDKKDIMNLIKYKKMLGGRRMNEISLREGLTLLKEAYCEDLYKLFAEEDIDEIVAEAEELKAEKENNNE